MREAARGVSIEGLRRRARGDDAGEAVGVLGGLGAGIGGRGGAVGGGRPRVGAWLGSWLGWRRSLGAWGGSEGMRVLALAHCLLLAAPLLGCSSARRSGPAGVEPRSGSMLPDEAYDRLLLVHILAGQERSPTVELRYGPR